MTKLSLLRTAVACVAVIFAQFAANGRTIRGCVYSDRDSTAIPGAACSLLHDGNVIAETSSGVNGNFELTDNAKPGVSLRLSMTGYNTTEIIIESAGDVNVGDVYMSEGVTLGEVTATGNSMIDVRGRTIVFPSAADVKASSTAITLFMKLPLDGLEANPINRTLSVDGGSPVILINGVPSSITDLNTLQPKDIAKIEYSRVTPARYLDSGNVGFISITLKKRDDGGQIYTWARSAVNTAFLDANVKASYHQGPSQFSVVYNPSWRNYQDVYDRVTQSFVGDDFRVDLRENDRNPFNYFSNSMQLKYDYSIPENRLFSVTFNLSPFKRKSRAIGETIDTELGDYDWYKFDKSHDFSPSLDLFFRKDFSTSGSIEVEVVGTLGSSDYQRVNTYTYATGDVDEYANDVDSRRHSLISEITYSHNFGKNTSLSGGYQNTLSRSTNSYNITGYKPVLTENNNYLYIRLGQQVGKVYLSASTGLKAFFTKNDVIHRDFVRNISSLSANWNIDSRWTISGSFQYTPTIPSLSSLTDYQQQQTPYLISNGNPDLKVAERFYYHTYAVFRSGKFTASYSVDYMDTKNSQASEVYYLGDKHFLNRTVNSRYYRYLRNYMQLRVGDISGFGAYLSFSYTHFRTAVDEQKHLLNTLNASVTLWWSKGPFTLTYWRTLPGKYLNGNYVGKYENGDSFSVEYTPDKHWTLGVSWMYILTKKGTKYPSWNYSEVNPSFSDRYIKNNADMIVLSATYSVDFGSIFRSSRRSLNNSDSGSSLLKL